MRNKDDPSYMYAVLAVLVAFFWGAVPTLAQLSDVDPFAVVFWVNLTALIAMAILTPVKYQLMNKFQKRLGLERDMGWAAFKEYDVNDYWKMVKVGFWWPLIYSIAFFGSIKYGGVGSLTSVLNYTWPIFFLIFALLWTSRSGKVLVKWDKNQGVAVGLSLFAGLLAASLVMIGGDKTLADPTWAIVGALVAAITQAWFTFKEKDLSKTVQDKVGLANISYDPWVVTFVIEVVTVIGISLYLLLNSSYTFTIPSTQNLVRLGFIGAVSNALGFWLFLWSNQLASKEGPKAKTNWIAIMSLTPLFQVIGLALTGNGHWYYLIPGILVGVGLYFHRRGMEDA